VTIETITATARVQSGFVAGLILFLVDNPA
jgi:hypothetical protein